MRTPSQGPPASAHSPARQRSAPRDGRDRCSPRLARGLCAYLGGSDLGLPQRLAGATAHGLLDAPLQGLLLTTIPITGNRLLWLGYSTGPEWPAGQALHLPQDISL